MTREEKLERLMARQAIRKEKWRSRDNKDWKDRVNAVVRFTPSVGKPVKIDLNNVDLLGKEK